jgi:hypothetical protein
MDYKRRCCDGSLSIPTRLRARLGFDSRKGQKFIHFSVESRLVVGPSQPPIQWVRGSLSPTVNLPGVKIIPLRLVRSFPLFLHSMVINCVIKYGLILPLWIVKYGTHSVNFLYIFHNILTHSRFGAILWFSKTVDVFGKGFLSYIELSSWRSTDHLLSMCVYAERSSLAIERQ